MTDARGRREPTGPDDIPGLIIRHRWTPRVRDGRLIQAHLDRQAGLDPLAVVRLDDGRIVPVGADAEGEGEPCE